MEIAIRSTLPACFWWQEVDKGRGLYLCTRAIPLVVQGAGFKYAMMARADTVIVCSLLLAKNALHSRVYLRGRQSACVCN